LLTEPGKKCVNVQTVGAGWDRILTLERNGKLTFTGYLVNTLLVFSCLFALLYPVFVIVNLFSFKCPFLNLTGLPCPGCGYTRSMESLVNGDIYSSFMHNPGWMVLIFFLATMIHTGLRSVIGGRKIFLGKRWLILFIVLLGSTWIGKFILGSAYY